MIKKVIYAVAVAGLLASPALADVSGTWRSAKTDDGASISVKIDKCGASYCGRITKLHKGAGTPKGPTPKIKGKQIIKGMKTKNGKSFYGGQIYAPDTKKWYTSKMQLSGNRLRVSGCVAKIFCRSQTWRRE